MTLVHPDARGRLSLGKLIDPDRDYRLTTGAHGRITLEPVTVVSDYEKAVLANPDLVAALDQARAEFDAGNGVRITRDRNR